MHIVTRVIRSLGDNTYELISLSDRKLIKQHARYMHPSTQSEILADCLPDVQIWGRFGKYLNDPRLFEREQRKAMAELRQAAIHTSQTWKYSRPLLIILSF